MRQTVLRLAFAEPLRYSQNRVYETPNFSFPFKCLGNFLEPKSDMVLLEGESLNSLFDALEEWEYHLASIDAERLRCDDDPDFTP